MDLRMKTLPKNTELEASILGAILLRNDVLGQLNLDTDDFYDPRHRHVFAAMRNLEAQRLPIDVEMVAAAINPDVFAAIGGYSLLGEASLRVPSPESAVHYAATVRDHRIARDAILGAADVGARLATQDVAGAQASALLRRLADQLDTLTVTARGRTIGELVQEEFSAIERDAAAQQAGQIVRIGMPTGLTKLDAGLGGLPLGLVTILAGRPGNGKTTLAQTFVRAVGRETQDSPLFYSYEDGDQSFAQREIAAVSNVPTSRIRSRSFQRDDLVNIGQYAPRVMRQRPIIVQASGMTADDVVRDVRRRRSIARDAGYSVGQLVVVDYIQRMPVDATRQRYDQAIGEVCNRFVDLAATEKIAVVVGSQLNRNLETRDKDSRRPQLSDLRDSGRLEELAKVVIAVHRPAKYDPTAPGDLLELCLLKNHQGPADMIYRAHWNMETHKITDHPDDARRR